MFLEIWEVELTKKLFLTIGHSVVRREDGVWMPSGVYQEIVKSDDGRIERTHIHRPDLNPNDPNAYLGGGVAVCDALGAIWNEYAPMQLPKPDNIDFAIIGGVPPSQAKRFGPDTPSEASVMAHYFRFGSADNVWLTHSDGCDGSPLHYPYAEVVEGTKNTEDDMREMLSLAAKYEATTVVLMGFRIPRARKLMQDFVSRNPDFRSAKDSIEFVDAEQFLPMMFDDFVQMNQSPAYALTMSQERFGLNKLLGGGLDQK